MKIRSPDSYYRQRELGLEQNPKGFNVNNSPMQSGRTSQNQQRRNSEGVEFMGDRIEEIKSFQDFADGYYFVLLRISSGVIKIIRLWRI